MLRIQTAIPRNCCSTAQDTHRNKNTCSLPLPPRPLAPCGAGPEDAGRNFAETQSSVGGPHKEGRTDMAAPGFVHTTPQDPPRSIGGFPLDPPYLHPTLAPDRRNQDIWNHICTKTHMAILVTIYCRLTFFRYEIDPQIQLDAAKNNMLCCMQV